MHFEESRIGDYRIYAGAVEAPRGDGYTAAVVVERRLAGQPSREVLRDEHLACGHRWPSAAEALAYAMQKARAVIRQQSDAAVC